MPPGAPSGKRPGVIDGPEVPMGIVLLYILWVAITVCMAVVAVMVNRQH